MDLIQTAVEYVERILTCTDGMKILVLDEETLRIISTVCRNNTLLEKEIYLTAMVDTFLSDKDEALSFLACIFFVRPTAENIKRISLELTLPQYSKYFIFFSGRIEIASLEYLARCDSLEKVVCVEECYIDYIPVSSFHYVFGTERFIQENSPVFQRTFDGLVSFIISSGTRPAILFSSASSNCFLLANNLEAFLDKHERIFEAENRDKSLLVVLDRRFDLITPLITDWNYNAMLHNFLKMNAGRIKEEKTKEETSLCIAEDAFYRQSLFSNFGEMGENIKMLVNKLKDDKSSLGDMQMEKDLFFKFQKYLENKTNTKSVQDHLSLFARLNKEVEAQALYFVSETEQEIVAGMINTIEKLEERVKELKKASNDYSNLFSIFFLYALKQKSFDRDKLSDLAKKEGIESNDLKTILTLCQSTQFKRAPLELLSADTIKKFGKGFFVKEKETSIHTKHKPLLCNLFESVEQGKYSAYELKETRPNGSERKTTSINFFIVGGSTHAEGYWAEEHNKKEEKQVVVGGTDVLTKKRFIRSLRQKEF